MKKTILALTLAAVAAPVAPALADPPPWAPAHGHRAKQRGYDNRVYDRRIYDNSGRYYQPRRLTRSDRVWRGNDGRYYCRRANGTTGLIIGAGVGALAGSQIAGDQTLGAIIGGVAGGLLGREIDRGRVRCR